MNKTNTIPHLSPHRLNIISVLIQTIINITGIIFKPRGFVQKSALCVTQKQKIFFVNMALHRILRKLLTRNRGIDSKAMRSIYSSSRNKLRNFCPYGQKNCPYRSNGRMATKKVGKATFEGLLTSST